jgi:hypothetical protein
MIQDTGVDKLAEQVIENYLENKETLIWAGRPYQGRVWKSKAFVYALWMIGLAIFTLLLPPNKIRAPMIPKSHFVTLLLLVGILITLWPLLIEPLFRRQLFYGLTNHRLLIVIRFAPGRAQSYPLGLLSNVSLEQSEDGLGSILFDRTGTSREPMRLRPVFYRIQNPQKVCDLISLAQREWKYQE